MTERSEGREFDPHPGHSFFLPVTPVFKAFRIVVKTCIIRVTSYSSAMLVMNFKLHVDSVQNLKYVNET